MKITHQEFLYTLKKARHAKKFQQWLLESFAFDDDGARYIKPELRKLPNGWGNYDMALGKYL